LLQNCILNNFWKKRKKKKTWCLLEFFKKFIKGDLRAQGYREHWVMTFRRSKFTKPGSPELRWTSLLILKVRIDE